MLFIDGVSDGTPVDISAAAAEAGNGTAILYLGGRATANPFTGSIGDARIFRRLLTRPEIRRLANATNGRGYITNIRAPRSRYCPTLDVSNRGTNTAGDLGYSNNDGSLQNMEAGDWVDEGGGLWHWDFDGVTNEYIQIADTDDHSFGDGSTDQPFSVSAWVNMRDTTQFGVASRLNSGSLSEWHFGHNASNQLRFRMVDTNSINYIDRDSSADAGLADTWVHFVGRYDGSAVNTGITVYKNGVYDAGGVDSGGTYVAMDNLAIPTWIGREGGVYANGLMDDIIIFGDPLSLPEIALLSDPLTGRGFDGLAAAAIPRRLWKRLRIIRQRIAAACRSRRCSH